MKDPAHQFHDDLAAIGVDLRRISGGREGPVGTWTFDPRKAHFGADVFATTERPDCIGKSLIDNSHVNTQKEHIL